MAAVGKPNIKNKLLKGYQAGEKTYRVHIDGFNQMDLLQGKGQGLRNSIYYFDDESHLNAVRWGDWKVIFASKDDWFYGQRETYTIPKVVNLRLDPFERSLDSHMYFRWALDQLWIFMPIKDVVGQFLGTFRDFPPRQKSLSLKVDDVMERLQRAAMKRE